MSDLDVDADVDPGGEHPDMGTPAPEGGPGADQPGGPPASDEPAVVPEAPAVASEAPPALADEQTATSGEQEEPEGDPQTTGTAEGSKGTTFGFEPPPAMSRMHFVDVVMVLPSTHPVVILQEAEVPYRELRIPIGGAEGIAIGYAGRRIATPRPLTHELMTKMLEGFGLTLEMVLITGMSGGTFTAEATVSGPAGQKTFDCRPSDAIALALRQQLPVPIMADVAMLDQAGGVAAGTN